MAGGNFSNASAGMLSPTARSRPSFFGYLLLLYRGDASFRGFVEFTLIAGVLVFCLTMWPSQNTQNNGQEPQHSASQSSGQSQGQNAASSTTTSGQQQTGAQHQVASSQQQSASNQQALTSFAMNGVSIQFPAEVTHPSLKNFLLIDVDETAFSSSPADNRPKLAAATRAYRAEQFAQVTEALKSADPTDRNVMFMRAMALVNSADPGAAKTAIPMLRSAKDAGQRQAAIVLGRELIVAADPAVKNVEEGRTLLDTAASGGDRVAQRLAGIGYMSGEIGLINFVKARGLFQTASAAGDVPAMLTYSFMLGWGIRGPADQAMAADLLRRAAADGLTTAQETLGQWLIAQFDHKQIDDPREALEWLTKAAQSGHSIQALEALVLFFADQNRTPPWNLKNKAYEWARLCSGLRNPWCQAENGWLFEHGIGVEPDAIRATAHYQVAVQLGFSGVGELLQDLMGRLSDANKTAAINQSQAITAALRPDPIPWHMQYVGVPRPPDPWAVEPNPPGPTTNKNVSASPNTAAAVPAARGVAWGLEGYPSPKRLMIKAPDFSGELIRVAGNDWRFDWLENGKSEKSSTTLRATAETDGGIEWYNSADKRTYRADLNSRNVYLRNGDRLERFANIIGTAIEGRLNSTIELMVRLPDGMPSQTIETFETYLGSFGEKALAISLDHQHSGRSWNGKSIEDARSVALKYCGSDCRIYAVDNFALDVDQPLHLPAGMSQEMIDNFAKYVAAPDEKAFAIGSNGTQFGWIEQAKTISDARTRALELCGSTCRIYAVGNVVVGTGNLVVK